MNDAKESYYAREILNCLMNKEIVSIAKVASIIGLSEKSTRNKVIIINEYLKENDLGEISKKPRIGMWLEANDEQKIKIQNFLINKKMINFSYNDAQRVYEILKILFRLYDGEAITTSKLSQKLYLSTPTILKIIKKCKSWLSNYNIKIVNERNRGFYLLCKENEYRVGFKNFLIDKKNKEGIDNLLNHFFTNINVFLIRKSIIETEEEWNYRFTDESFYEILIYCCLAYQRKNTNMSLIYSNEEIELLQRYNEYPFTVAIFKKIQEKSNVLFSNEDVLFLAVQIMCSKFIGTFKGEEILIQVKKYDNKLIEFVDKMLSVVGNILDTDLISDKKLKESLIFHLRPTIFRIRYGATQSNSLINFIKKEYKNVFRATWVISLLFEEYYGLQITEDEVGYIVLYIQSSLERRKYQYNVILLSDSNMGHAQLLSERIKKVIPEINNIEILSIHDFKIYNHKDIDIIITSKNLNIKDNRIININNLLSDNGMAILRNYTDSFNLHICKTINPFSPECFPLFSPELIFIDMKINDKKQLLRYMSKEMEKKGYVTSKFYNSVIKREELTTTSIGNRVSLPHGDQAEVLESKVAISILKNPIIWDDDLVEIVFLLGIKMDTQEEIKRVQLFYKQYVSLVETDEKVMILKKMKSNLDFYKYLIQ